MLHPNVLVTEQIVTLLQSINPCVGFTETATYDKFSTFNEAFTFWMFSELSHLEVHQGGLRTLYMRLLTLVHKLWRWESQFCLVSLNKLKLLNIKNSADSERPRDGGPSDFSLNNAAFLGFYCILNRLFVVFRSFMTQSSAEPLNWAQRSEANIWCHPNGCSVTVDHWLIKPKSH